MSIKQIIKNMLPDKLCLKIMYKRAFNKKLDFSNPTTFNEKLQWLKVYNRNPEYTKLVDKYEVKDYIEKTIGKEYIIPTLGVWDKFEDIDFSKLPEQFVLKCTHDSGGLVICRDKSNLDMKIAKDKIDASLRRNYYYEGREWPYKNVKPRIIAEEYIENKDKSSLCDYKFYCFDGKVDYTMICTGRETGTTKFYYIDRKGKLQREMTRHGMELEDESVLNIPNNLTEMFEMAEKLSKGFKFIRVDLYSVDGKIYFGEYTFFPAGGFDPRRTEATEKYLNSMLNINE